MTPAASSHPPGSALVWPPDDAIDVAIKRLFPTLDSIGRNHVGASLGHYRDGFAAGVLAAAKVCKRHADAVRSRRGDPPTPSETAERLETSILALLPKEAK